MARNRYDVDETLEDSFDLNQVKRLANYIKPYKKEMGFVIFMMLSSSALTMLIPIFFQKIMDVCIPAKDMKQIFVYAGLTLVIALYTAFSLALKIKHMSSIGQNIIHDLRYDIFKHLQELPFSYFDDKPHGKIQVRVVNYVNSLSDLLSNGIVNTLTDLCNLIFILIFMLIEDVRLTLICLTGLPLLALVIVFCLSSLPEKVLVQRLLITTQHCIRMSRIRRRLKGRQRKKVILMANQYMQEEDDAILKTYNRYPVVLDHGEGVKLYDTDGKEYLDFGAGIAVCALGYGDKEYTDALKAQIDKGIHFSNYFYSEPLLQAAKGLAKATGLDRVFMANSGTEANEGALKMARKYAIMQGHENRHEIISMNKAFHGRSMGALSVTGTAKYREPFEPMLQGVTFADYNDLESVKAAVTENTYAIIVEAVQGEGGIYPANAEFLQGIRKLCDENDIVMICDEIQCGMGRSGKMFAYQNYDIVPDIVTMAKGIGNGITVGAIAAKEEVAKCLVPGDHGTTFGGNPLACAAVAKTLEIFEKREIPNHVEEVGEYLSECLQKLVEKKEIAVETRGMGLMRGLELSVPAGPYITKALEKGVIFMSAGANVIRFIPPLIIEKSDVDKMIAILDSVLDD